jgi:hypothetical protein
VTVSLSSLGLAALSYSQEYGMPVFPLEPRGKKPMIDGGFRFASQHPEQVCAWWDRWPDANIGFSPGSCGWLVLDLDSPDAERFAHDELGLVSSLAVVTSKGRHLYYALPEGITIGNGSPWKRYGIDVRGHNGYVLLPPSIHESGHVYRWEGELD